MLLLVPVAQVVEHPLQEKVVGSTLDRAIPKAFKMVPVATLLSAQHYKATSGLSCNKYHTTNIASLPKESERKV